MAFNSILDKYRAEAFSKRDQGDRFERLMKAYLLTDPKYAQNFEKVWLWGEFPFKDDFGGKDTGIDLVALTKDKEYWAIQCKFYGENARIDKSSLDSFLSTSSKSFEDENANTVSFSIRLWISTSNNWSSTAEDTIKNQNPEVIRISLQNLIDAPVDWEKLANDITGEQARTAKKVLRAHQEEALQKTHDYFKDHDRGKLVMACGTGKTFNSLRIAEHETDGKGFILFLVPSIALLGQTLNEWYADAKETIHAICICSDSKITKNRKKLEDIDTSSIVDLAYPASTDVENVLRQFAKIEKNKPEGLTVVFSTYQSIDVIAEAQKELAKQNSAFSEFDLIICDEAHRTTGVTLSNSDDSAFVKVHKNDFLKAKKRLYMTATPRLYDENSKSKAAEASAVLCSMDDEDLYGKEIYRIGFGEAVERDLLTDYKVLVLTLNENDISPSVQKMIAGKEHEINTDDATKLIGTINALSKQILGDEGIIKTTDPEPMRRAVAFCQNIAISKSISETYNTVTDEYISDLPKEKQSEMQSISSRHIDGTMDATKKSELLAWLKEDPKEKECKVLTNVRVLSEGVDVPSLDAVLFLSARNSQVDVVQSVGRVMRKSPGKKYGYIIIPVVVPSNVETEKALDDNERYRVVWTILNALRAHDDRFNATVNKIELNKKKPNQILVGRPAVSFDENENPVYDDSENSETRDIAKNFELQFEELQSIVFAKMVQKVGDRRYWEQWAKSVAEIAQRQKDRITKLIERNEKYKIEFESFLEGLQKNINTAVTETEAIEMLSQHIITKPVFDALFENYSFVKNNPVSKSMQAMLDLLQEQNLEKDAESLEKFYESVKKRAEDIDNAEGKQKIIIELYDKFFKTAFPKMVEQLGIVYTPIEIVDFILQSVNDVLKKEFGREISDENVHVLDPFTGTGTFIVRLLQSGLIQKNDLERKYKNELHANEIVLLAYYIAAINVENAYHDALKELKQKDSYAPFEGIVLTDTFQLNETDNNDFLSKMFPENSERVQKQKNAPIQVIVGNPPYSIGQKSANDNAQNQAYPKLDSRIAETYAAQSSAGLNKSLYDAYIKAFRWSTDRLASTDLENKGGGIICFVSNGAWLDGNSTDGFRKAIEKEFTAIYVFNLRGNQRTSGELSRKEGGKIFGSGSRTPISITLLVKNPKTKTGNAKVYYHDIGDYLNREEKLKIVQDFKSFANIPLKELKPNEHGDWINARNEAFSAFIPIDSEKKYDIKSQSFFTCVSGAVVSSRDAWCYNFSKNELQSNIQKTIEYYNEQRELIAQRKQKEPIVNSKKGSWSRDWQNFLTKNKIIIEENEYRVSQYRPFVKVNTYFADDLNQERYQLPKFFPNLNTKNLTICVTGKSLFSFSALISNHISEFGFLNGRNGTTQIFPLYYYEENKTIQKGLFDDTSADSSSKYIRRDAVSDFILDRAKKQYGKNVSKEDIFYYVYGFLHSKEYRETFANDLKKMLPRLPLVDDVRDFWAFSKAGRALAELHLNYESVEAYKGVIVKGAESQNFEVEKMRFPTGEKARDFPSTIHYNHSISIENIPKKAYEYVVNGKSAIEWIMERYQVTIHKDSQIKNDPNDWAKEHNQPRYILDLLLSIINVSVQTVDIVNDLPKIDFETTSDKHSYPDVNMVEPAFAADKGKERK